MLEELELGAVTGRSCVWEQRREEDHLTEVLAEDREKAQSLFAEGSLGHLLLQPPVLRHSLWARSFFWAIQPESDGTPRKLKSTGRAFVVFLEAQVRDKVLERYGGSVLCRGAAGCPAPHLPRLRPHAAGYSWDASFSDAAVDMGRSGQGSPKVTSQSASHQNRHMDFFCLTCFPAQAISGFGVRGLRSRDRLLGKSAQRHRDGGQGRCAARSESHFPSSRVKLPSGPFGASMKTVVFGRSSHVRKGALKVVLFFFAVRA